MAGMFGSGKYSKHFEINLDSPFVVFYGDQNEAEPVTLTGTITLNSPDHMSVRSIKIRLEGKWKVAWSVNSPSSSSQNASHSMVKDRGTLVHEEQTIFPSGLPTGSTHRIAPGKHEWRFKFVIDPSLPESVEGLPGSCIVYNLAAEIDRGYMSKALLARKHVRIIRTLSRDVTDTVPFPYSNDDTWTDKIKYHIYIPGRYFAFGTSIPVDFTLIPLRKGIQIGKIKMEVLERLGLETSKQGEEHSATTLADKVVGSVEQQIPVNSSRQLMEPSSGIADESYHFRVILPLKKSLNACRQSVNTQHIKIYHNLKIYVNIHNPDGHISQLCLRNLIHIYISPHTPINDDQSIATPITAVQNLGSIDDAFDSAPPPTYGTHVLDQLYQDIDTSGFISGITTPSHFLSRAQSSENLAGLFATPAGHNHQSREPSETGSNRSSGSVTDSAALQLQTRLQALQDRRPSISSITDTPIAVIGPPLESGNHNSPHLDTSIFDVIPATAPHSNRNSHIFNRRPRAQSLRNSVHLDPASAAIPRNTPPMQHAFNLEELNRIPSYRTAVRAQPPANISPDSEGLPSYDFAVGLSSSTLSGQSPTPPPTPPADDHPMPSSICPPPAPISAIAPSPHLSARRPSSSSSSSSAPQPHRLGAPTTPPPTLQLPDYREARHPGLGGRPRALQRAHVRGTSVGAVPDRLLRAGGHQQQPQQQQQQRTGAVMGGGSLQGLWSGMRRGSQ